MKENHIDRC